MSGRVTCVMWRISTGSIERRDLREWQKVFLGREVFGNLCSVAAASVCSGFTTAVAAVDQYLRITNSLHTMPPQARSKRLSHLTTLPPLSPPVAMHFPVNGFHLLDFFLFSRPEIGSPCKPLFIFQCLCPDSIGWLWRGLEVAGPPTNAEAYSTCKAV